MSSFAFKNEASRKTSGSGIKKRDRGGELLIEEVNGNGGGTQGDFYQASLSLGGC